jgi:hypothetical protein
MEFSRNTPNNLESKLRDSIYGVQLDSLRPMGRMLIFGGIQSLEDSLQMTLTRALTLYLSNKWRKSFCGKSSH